MDGDPQPDENNVEDRKGIPGWVLNVAAGETQITDIRTELTWPEDKVLR